ncbi:MAG: peptidoglycan DD-metalloendopeptidase family protein [Eubacteriales bacterium]|nr:peptidoglycan DD-metalloendopeptidase family protein [Eubacteriales bacterium]
MQNRNNRKFTKKQGAILVSSLCLVVAAGFATFYTMDTVQKEKQESLEQAQKNAEIKAQEAKERQEAQEELAKAETEESAKLVSADDAQAELEGESADILANETDAEVSGLTAKETEEEVEDAASGQVQAEITTISPTVNYDDSTPLTWPVAGTLLMDYSMNSTVYFQTLDQYKYNPALIIGSEVGNQVIASAKGIVESVTVEDETGTTITLNLGNNYELVYGQLKEVTVKEGDVVEAGALLGYVSEPTKYYCEEGSNLFFEMKKDGEPVDPFLYME